MHGRYCWGVTQFWIRATTMCFCIRGWGQASWHLLVSGMGRPPDIYWQVAVYITFKNQGRVSDVHQKFLVTVLVTARWWLRSVSVGMCSISSFILLLKNTKLWLQRTATAHLVLSLPSATLRYLELPMGDLVLWLPSLNILLQTTHRIDNCIHTQIYILYIYIYFK